MTATATASSPKAAGSPGAAADEVLCTCVGLVRADAARTIAANPDMSFSDFLSRTGAGGKCTACYLDLEYFFTTEGAEPSHGAAATVTGHALEDIPVAARRFRHRVFAQIDRLLPPAYRRDETFVPILIYPGAKQALHVSNDFFLYGGEHRPAPSQVRIHLWDSAGRLRHRGTLALPPGGYVTEDLSQYLPPGAAGRVAAGSLRVEVRALASGEQGTTRPHITITAPHGHSALHTGARNYEVEKYLRVVSPAPGCRVFLAFLNHSWLPQQFFLEYPQDAASGRIRWQETVPPHGCTTVELERGAAAGETMLLKYGGQLRRANSAYLYYANDDLSQFSVDHPG